MRMERKYVRRRRILAAIVFILVVFWLNDITTPDECKKPVEQLSQFCIDLRFPG